MYFKGVYFIRGPGTHDVLEITCPCAVEHAFSSGYKGAGCSPEMELSFVQNYMCVDHVDMHVRCQYTIYDRNDDDDIKYYMCVSAATSAQVMWFN